MTHRRSLWPVTALLVALPLAATDRGVAEEWITTWTAAPQLRPAASGGFR